jgi:apyrase
MATLSANFVMCALLATLACNPVNGFLSSVKCKLFGSGCPTPEDNVKYSVLFDAGSSSTKLKVYKITPASDPANLPKIELQYDERFDPGLSDAEDVDSYLESILEVAKEKVPQSKHSSTPISLKATAGLRFLTADDATELVGKVRSVFEGDASPFKFKPEDAGILSGEEEGVYAWVAANYLLGFFSGNKPDSEAVGVLEMGGGSTQITFVPVSPLYDGEFQVFIKGRKFELYVHSYLQFGINAINIWVGQVLSNWKPGRNELDNPCMLRDDTMVVKLEDGRNVTLKGSGDPVYCKQVFEHILKPETGLKCEPKPCAIGNIYQPDVEGIHFYATQGFTYAPGTLGVVGDDKILHINELESAAEKHCDQSLEEAVAAGVQKKIASITCTMGLYIPTLFKTSYKFDSDTNNIKLTSNVGDASIDWAIGATVIEASGSGNSVRRRRRRSI